MLILKTEPEKNGARANQFIAGGLDRLPEGWIAVPEEMESGVSALLPWAAIEIENGAVTAFTENTQARIAYEKEKNDELNK